MRAVGAIVAVLLMAWAWWRLGHGAPAPTTRVLLLAAAAALASALFHAGGADFSLLASIGWVGVAMTAGLALGQHRPDWWGLTRIGLALCIACGLAALAASAGVARGPQSWQINLHAALALIAYALLSLATLQALLYFYSDRQLRRHRRPAFGLAPLLAQETLLFQLVSAGFVLLSATLLSGALFTYDWRSQHLAHKIVFTALAWILFGSLLVGRARLGWRGRTAVRLTLVGMAALGLAFLGSKFVLEVLLQRGA